MADLAPFEDEVNLPKVAPVNVATAQHSTTAIAGFQDFCLKTELTNAIREQGFEHPSEVQHQALPQAMLGNDVLAQAKAGMGKTAVFIFAILEQLQKIPEGEKPYCQAIVVANARELAYQIENEFKRFNKYLPHATTAVFYGGKPEEENIKTIKRGVPAIVVATPGRLATLVKGKHLNVDRVKVFVVDEFDRSLEDVRMRRDVQTAFLATPREKQVMMFSATMTEELREVARKFMRNPTEIYVDQQSKLTLHGLTQFYANVTTAEKNRKLTEILDNVDFNQVIIFTSAKDRCEALAILLNKLKFPAKAMHSGMDQTERLKVYDSCKKNETRIIVSTDIFGRGVDIDRINLVVQYDMASDPDQYLHRVGRAGRFGTKGVTIAFLTDETHEYGRPGEKKTYNDKEIMKEVQDRFEAHAHELTDIKEQLQTDLYQAK